MGALTLVLPASVSKEISVRSRNGGELGTKGGVVLHGARIRGRNCSRCYSGNLVPVPRCFRGSGNGGGSIRSVSCAGGLTENDCRYFVAQGLGRIVGLRSIGTARSTSGRGGSRGRDSSGSSRIVMRSGEDKSDNNSGDDQVETLFMRELRRRGMSSKEQDGGSLGSTGTDTKTKEDDSEPGRPFGGGWSRPGASKTKPPPQLTDSQRNEQLKRSMALNSEGLDGLLPRVIELVKLGGTFFLGLWPFILAIIVAFLAVYLYFGSAFIHAGNNYEEIGRQPLLNPSQLLDEEVPSEIGPNRVPYNYRSGSYSP